MTTKITVNKTHQNTGNGMRYVDGSTQLRRGTYFLDTNAVIEVTLQACY